MLSDCIELLLELTFGLIELKAAKAHWDYAEREQTKRKWLRNMKQVRTQEKQCTMH